MSSYEYFSPIEAFIPATIVFSITALLHVVFGIYFAYAKNTFPLRARSPSLMIILWIMISVQMARVYSKAFVGNSSCLVEAWLTGTLTFIHVLTVLVRCVRLLLIFNLAKYTLQETESDDPDGAKEEKMQLQPKKKAKSFWSNPKLVSDKYMLILLAISCGVALMVPIATTLSEALWDDPNACYYPSVYGSYALYALVCCSVVSVAVKLRKVHDAFFLKNEFKLFALIGIPIAIIQAVLNAIEEYRIWSPFVANLIYLTNTITSFVIPSIISFKKNAPFSMSGLSKSTSGTESISMEEPKQAKPIDLLKDKEAMKYIEEFLAHYQLIRQSRNLLCYFDLLKFRELSSEFARTSKAYLLFQKYMEEDAYIQVDLVTEDARESLRNTITKALDKYNEVDAKSSEGAEDVTISEDLFDDLLVKLRKELKRRLIRPFMASEFYQKYLEAVRLSKGLQEVHVASVQY